MTVVHVALLSFKPDVTQQHRDDFLSAMKSAREWPHVQRILVGHSSLMGRMGLSMGFEYCFVSYHENLAALRQYQALDAHHRIVSKYMYHFEEQLCIFDFELDPEDEEMGVLGSLPTLAGKIPNGEVPA